MPWNKKEQPGPKGEYDAASGRPLVRDIIVRAKKEAAPPPPAVKPEAAKPFFKRRPEPAPPLRPEIRIKKTSPTREEAAPLSSPLIFGSRPGLAPKPAGRGRSLSLPALYWSAGAVLGFTVMIFLLNYFAVAVVVLTPRQEFLEVSSNVRASAAAAADLSLEVINFDETALRTGVVSNLKEIEEKAKGRVMIFNSFSSEPQKLVAGTRLEAPNGRIYRLPVELRVPGAKVDNGKIQPQGIETDVVADRAGEEYNLGLSDFTVPGFKGTPKFDKFYARSKTEIAGGFVGTVPVVSEDDVKKLTADAAKELSLSLRARLKSDLPEGVFVPGDAYEISVQAESTDPPVGSRGERVTIKIKATLKGLAVKKRDIDRFLGRSYLGLGTGEEVNILNFDKLSLEVSARDFGAKTLNLAVKGKAHFVWQFDEAELRKDLVEAYDNRTGVFEKYGAIERAKIDFRPFWWRIFPKDVSRVKVEQILSAP
ncbi:hypothetical protein HY406_01300 [Candidatus Giovannonibacteria bacterium]|nr:hypothetical protein [Candidatus Giovannonibacteria bacterium]